MEVDAIWGAGILIASVLLGSVPFGLFVGKLAGIRDARAHGSGNIGATNLLRLGGPIVGGSTLLLDGAKGALAVGATSWLTQSPTLSALSGIAAVAGHCFSPLLRFRGGKGVATLLGVLLALYPLSGLLFILSWAAMAGWKRIASLASLVASCVGCASVAFGLDGGAWLTVALAIVVVRHRDNLRRLSIGTEPKIGRGPVLTPSGSKVP